MKHPAAAAVTSPLGKKILIWGGVGLIGIIGFVIIKKQVKKIKERQTTKETLENIDFELDKMIKQEGLSYPQSEYDGMVSKLKKSFDGCGTTDENVYGVFQKLNNNADFLKLKSVWGVQTWDGCNWAMNFGDEEGTLTEAIASEMDTDEIEKINKILKEKGISYSV